MEVQQVHWWWLADLDRKYHYHYHYHYHPHPPGAAARPAPAIPSSVSHPTPSATLLPGSRPLPPSMHSARELFIVGRRYKILFPGSGQGKLSRPFTIVLHTKHLCLFSSDEELWMVVKPPSLRWCLDQARRLSWAEMEEAILADRVRWLNSVQTLLKRQARLALLKRRLRTPRKASRPSGPDRISS